MELDGEEPSAIGLGRLSVLLKRWMGRGSQGNLYLLTGVGAAEWGGADLGLAWMGGVQADYETQRVYTALIGRVLGDQ